MISGFPAPIAGSLEALATEGGFGQVLFLWLEEPEVPVGRPGGGSRQEVDCECGGQRGGLAGEHMAATSICRALKSRNVRKSPRRRRREGEAVG